MATQPSILLTLLQDILQQLRPAWLRPDLHDLRAQAVLAEVEKLEGEGHLVLRDGVLIAKASDSEVGRVMLELQIHPNLVSSRLQAVGLNLATFSN